MRDLLDPNDAHSFESVGSIMRAMLSAARPTGPVITASRFQPFKSRVGQDTVVKLMFAFNKDLIDDLKTAIRKFELQAVNPARNIYVGGGWLPVQKTWFVEEAAWPSVRGELRTIGYIVNDRFEQRVA